MAEKSGNVPAVAGLSLEDVSANRALLISPSVSATGYCFFSDTEAAADAVAVSFLYSALA